MNCASANLPAVRYGGLKLGFFLFGFAKGVWLACGVVSDRVLPRVFQLVVIKVGLLEVGALFEHDHSKTRCGEFFGKNASSGARSDNHEINFGTRVKAGPWLFH
jgi:hypothetical protein